MPMTNTFTGAVMNVQNQTIRAFVNEVIKMRKQLTVRGEFKSQGGWPDALNALMKSYLQDLTDTVKRIIYSPSGANPDDVKKARVAEARNVDQTLADAWDKKSLNIDDVVMPTLPINPQITHDFTGNDPDLPQPTPALIPNDYARDFIVGMDTLVVMATNFDSRTQMAMINSEEALQLLAQLNALYGICELKGGDTNRAPITTGVMPSQAANTFNSNGQFNPTGNIAK